LVEWSPKSNLVKSRLLFLVTAVTALLSTSMMNTSIMIARTQSKSASRAMSTMLSNLNGNRFDDHALKAAVSTEVYDSFHASVESGEACDKATSKALSQALMDWATERGATMKAHWFR
jgi:glutamine synthetase type III